MKQKIPTSLKVVAWLFILGGIMDAIEILIGLTQDHLNIDLGVINIFAGIGLLNLRSGWRTFSLVMIWLALIFVPVAFIIMAYISTPIDFNFFGQKVGEVSKLTAFILGTIIYAVIVWEYRVLNRADVKALFIKLAEPEGGLYGENAG